mmetsp:Transcript_6107/g.6974  ORF Transcript_6107/g.6974 Transcript_6107/m.6974 type:complete len:111 (+) Transcript_6107:503-835(+)
MKYSLLRPPSNEREEDPMPLFNTRPSSPGSIHLTPLGEKVGGKGSLGFGGKFDQMDLDDTPSIGEVGKKAQMQAIKNQLIARKRNTTGKNQFLSKYGLGEAHDLFAPRGE